MVLILGFGAGDAMAQQAGPFAGQTLKVATFGGSWQQWVAKTVGSKFKAQTGADVEFVPGIPVQFLAQMVANKGQSVPFDTVDLSDDLGPQAAAQDLLVPKVDPAVVSNLAKLPEAARNPNGMLGPANFVSVAGVVYDADKFKEAGLAEPVNWDALADPKLAGHVAIPDITFVYRSIYAAINNLKTGDPTNFDGALGWVKSLKDPVIYNEFPSLQTRFGGGEIWAIVGSAGYVLRLASTGKHIKFVVPASKGGMTGAGFSSISPVKGTTKLALAQHWINIFLATDTQVAMINEVGFAPVNREAIDRMKSDPKVGSLIVSDPAQLDAAFKANWTDINKAFPDWVERWNKTVRR
jgi:putative spermidine/putrescine transport system substrate-binding protein